jgi:hypothetical protein
MYLQAAGAASASIAGSTDAAHPTRTERLPKRLAAAACASLTGLATRRRRTMRIAGNFSSTRSTWTRSRSRSSSPPQAHRRPLAVNYNPMDTVGVRAADALRHHALRHLRRHERADRHGLARLTRFFEGLDLIGVSPNMGDLRKGGRGLPPGVRPAAARRASRRVMTLWPFGPQVFYCNKPIKGLDDMKA